MIFDYIFIKDRILRSMRFITITHINGDFPTLSLEIDQVRT